MNRNTIKLLSKVLCLVLIASFALEAPLMAVESIKVNVGGQPVQVTPGQWISVKQGANTVNYNVRYVNGQPVALEMSQYIKLIFGNNTTAPTLPTSTAAGQSVNTSAQTPAVTSAPVTGQTSANTTVPANTGTVAANAPVQASIQSTAVESPTAIKVDLNQAPTAAGQTTAAAPTTTSADGALSVQSGAKSTSGSWIKNELKDYGSKITDSFSSGKDSGKAFGTKTVETVKTGAGKVGDVVKTGGSKIGDLLRGAKERIANIFHKNPPAAKTGGSSQSSQSDQAGQSKQSDQSNQSGQSDQAGQPNKSEQAAGQSDQAGQAGQAGQSTQTGQAAQSGEKKPGFMEKTGAKFKAGYGAGKQMAGQGVQNVKDSLKSGFSAKNLLVTAGITVGVDLAKQIMTGEKPSFRKAIKTVASAEFAGSVVGSVTGAAAGSFFTPFLTAIPVVGGVLSALAPTLGSIVGGSVGAYLAGDLKNGRFSLKAAFKAIDWVGVAGQTVGSTLGAMLGSMVFPPIGTIVGGMVGGYLGNWAAHKIAGLFGKGRQPTTGFGSPAFPVGTNPYDASQAIGSSVSMGATAGGSEIAVSGDQAAPVDSNAQIPIAGSLEPIGTYASEVQLAYAKYQELYKLYNELLAQGRQEDAMKVASEMNKAKSEYDTLRANAGK